MIIRTANESDAAAWNRYVDAHPQATPYHRFGWKQAVEAAYGHRSCYLLAEKEEKICGVLPAIVIKPPLRSGSLCALPFCDRGDVIADDTATRNALLDQASQWAAEHRLKGFEQRATHVDFNDDEQALTGHKVRMLLPLPESADELLKSFKSKLRSQINKARKNGLTVTVSCSQPQIDAFYEVFSVNMHKLGSPVHSKQWFEQIREHYGRQMIVSTIWKDDQVAGAGIVLFSGDRAAIPWASTNAEFNRLAPNMLLYWSLLEYATERGCREFDFGRSTVGEGTYKFKKQWGARPVPLDWQQIEVGGGRSVQGQGAEPTNPAGPGKLRTLIESVWRKLPLALTIAVGPKIRKYISL